MDGDGSGVGGYRSAMTEGRIAGIAAAELLGAINEEQAALAISPFARRLRRLSRFRDAPLTAIYRVGPGLFELATPDTIVCRCEGRLARDLDELIEDGVADPNIVRARSRIGMGRCQGRNCMSFVSAAIARRSGTPIDAVPPLSARSRVKPVPIAAIAQEREQVESEIVMR